MAFPLTTEIDPITGKTRLTHLPNVPGAQETQPRQEVGLPGDPIDTALAGAQVASAQADEEEITEEEKLRAEHEDRAHKADLKALEFKKAAQEADRAAGRVGQRFSHSPEPEELLPDVQVPEEEMVFSEEEAAAAEAADADDITFGEGDEDVAGTELVGRLPADVAAFKKYRDEVDKTRKAEFRLAEQNRKDDLAHEKAKEKALEENARADALAEKEINDKVDAHAGKLDAFRKQHPRPPSPSVLNLVGVFLGGLLAPQQGGRNAALDMVMKRMQMETDVIMENRRTELSAMRQQGGVLRDEQREGRQDKLERDVVTLQNLAGLRSHMQARANAEHLPAVERARASEADALLGTTEGELIRKNIEDEKAWLLEQQKIASRERMAAAKAARSGKGGRGGSSIKPTAVDIAQNTYMGWHGQPISPNDPETWPKGVDFEDIGDGLIGGITVKGADGVVYPGVFAQNPKEGEKTRERLRQFNGLRSAAGDLSEELKALRASNGGTLKGLTILGLGKKDATRVARAINSYRIKLKNLWELGAIQAPDERLMDAETGANPTSWKGVAADLLDLGVMEDVLGETVAGSEASFITELRPLLPPSVRGGEVTIDKHPVGVSVRNRNKKKAAATSPQAVERLGKMFERMNNPVEGAEPVTPGEISEALDAFEAMADVGTGRGSASRAAGGQAIDGASIQELLKLRKIAGAHKPQVDRILDQVGNNPPGWAAAKKKIEKKFSLPGKGTKIPGTPGVTVGGVLGKVTDIGGLVPDPVTRGLLDPKKKQKEAALRKKRKQLRDLHDLSQKGK